MVECAGGRVRTPEGFGEEGGGAWVGWGDEEGLVEELGAVGGERVRDRSGLEWDGMGWTRWLFLCDTRAVCNLVCMLCLVRSLDFL